MSDDTPKKISEPYRITPVANGFILSPVNNEFRGLISDDSTFVFENAGNLASFIQNHFATINDDKGDE